MPGYEQTLHDNETRWLSGPGWLMLSCSQSTLPAACGGGSGSGVVRGVVIVERRTCANRTHAQPLQWSNPMGTGT